LSGAPDLPSFNENLSAFQYNLKSKILGQCGVCAATSASKLFLIEFIL